jgi:3',5'-cyclic-AMP phosphodiesterase
VRICVVSDTHLSPCAPEALSNWDAVVAYVDASRPDLVIHLGDLCLDGTDGAALDEARTQLDRLPVPWRAVPGNHDIGDNPWPGAPMSIVVDGQRRQAWLDAIGSDHWSMRFEGWHLLAINAQLLGSGLEAESVQWSWLRAELAAADATASSLALITHKPLTAPDDELADAPVYRFVPETARRRLADLTADRPLTLVVSGHVHQHRVLRLDGAQHVWAPSTWAVLPDTVQPRFGKKRCAILALELGDDGRVEPAFLAPDGLEQHTIGVDIADPYRH